jgi:phosphoribosylformylglycinamidine synthase PurS subunit
MARVVVDVMPKPEILDPQGKAVTGALARLGFAGISVRQGKRFELEVDGDLTEERLAEVRRAAETLLANTVIETFNVRVEAPPESPDEPDEDHPGGAHAPGDAESDEQAELATQAG